MSANLFSQRITDRLAVVRDMNERESARRRGFWPLALLWLPVGVVTTTAFRFMPEMMPSEMTGMWLPMVMTAAPSLIVVAPCGLPLALACRRLWWLGFRRAAWGVGAGLGAITVAVSLLTGLLGPLAIVVAAVVLSLPVWIAALWLARRG